MILSILSERAIDILLSLSLYYDKEKFQSDMLKFKARWNVALSMLDDLI